jgi:hypothetical protein
LLGQKIALGRLSITDRQSQKPPGGLNATTITHGASLWLSTQFQKFANVLFGSEGQLEARLKARWGLDWLLHNMSVYL